MSKKNIPTKRQKKSKFNAIITRGKNSDGLVFIAYNHGVLDGNCYPLKMESDFVKEEQVRGVLPEHKIILSDVSFSNETEMMIIPKYSVEIMIGNKKVSFWDIVNNQAYISYFLGKIKVPR